MMATLRAHLRKLQKLENKAAEIAGMRFLLLDERALMGTKSDQYIKDYVKQLEIDLFPVAIQAAKLGEDIRKETMV